MAKYQWNPPPAVQYTFIIIGGALVVGVGLFFGSDLIAGLLVSVTGN